MMDSRDSRDVGMELTSQGSGTYWYLPPECFFNPPPKISPKVDVWSCGVILYQMLLGKKPFGQGQTPETLVAQNTISNAREVRFPEKCSLSEPTKEFIKKCLTYDQHCRPDAKALFDHPYFKANFK